MIAGLIPVTILAVLTQNPGIATVRSTPSSVSRVTPVKPSIISPLGVRANALYQAGEYRRAAGLFEQGYRQSLQAGDVRLAIRRLNNLAGCRFAMFEYQAAMESYLEARRLAESVRDFEVLGTVALNIASLYLQMSDLDSAALAASQGLEVIGRHQGPDYPEAQLLTLFGRIRSLQGRVNDAERAYRAAVEIAMARGDASQAARTWDTYGYSRLRAGDLEQADACLTEAYRLRSLLHSKEIHLSYAKLARLRLAQQDLHSADVLSARALESARRNPGGSPMWYHHHTRGLVQEARGETQAAFRSFRTAIEEVRRWRLGVLPADALRATTDDAVSSIYGSFVRTGARLYFASKDPALLRETFEVMEQSRAAGLRESSASANWRALLPDEYGETLARLRLLESRLLRADSEPLRAEARAVRLRLLELETRAGLNGSGRTGRPAAFASLAAIQASLQPGEVLVSFLVDEQDSFAWTVTPRSASLSRLAGREKLSRLVQETADQVQAGEETPSAAAELARELFFQNEAKLRPASRWLLELDDVLFRVPVAALPDFPGAARARYLAERHSFTVVPSVLMSQPARSAADGELFVGVGDPVYNAADARFARPAQAEASVFGFWPWGGGESKPIAGPELPRLPASRQEILLSSAAWSRNEANRLTLLGPQATREDLVCALDRGPAVVHFATHVLKSALRPDEGLIALSLSRSGSARFLDSSSVRLLRVPGALVVLSGCSTGAGQVLRGAGLMGLTRAWLLAGARSVVASHWPTPDDSGEFFVSFYRHLRAAPAEPAAALRRAQLEMLESGTWRSRPSYWAAYFTYGKH